MESKKALDYAFYLLGYRFRAEVELRCRLSKRGFSLPVIQKTITYLKKNKYLSDADFVESYLATAREKKWGPLKIDYKLKKLGLSLKLRQKAATKAKKESGCLIKSLIREKEESLAKSKPDLTKTQKREKIARFLLARGFSGKQISQNLT